MIKTSDFSVYVDRIETIKNLDLFRVKVSVVKEGSTFQAWGEDETLMGAEDLAKTRALILAGVLPGPKPNYKVGPIRNYFTGII